MVQDRYQRIEAVFDAALALPPADRAAFVARECADDAALRAEVNRLLENDSRAGDGFLRPPPPDPRLAQVVAADQESLPNGTRIAAYTITSPIARGGMGTVYLAEQASPRREVALKILHAGPWSAAAQRRFEHESLVLARLSHPNIAQVFDAGRATPSRSEGEGEGQRPRQVSFFAMEFVPGAKRITEFASENQLDMPARLGLFLQVCDAVQHGHQRGIIHRDLKPANILVGADGAYERTSPDSSLRASVPACLRGSVKIIDFGVARCVDSDVALTTMHTETGQLIGTLAYMSPEQCDADPLGLDVRSDVYSLGVVLYELLCGRLPYDVSKTSIVAAARTIREAEPARPSVCSGRRLAGRSNRDLETILLKTLEKDRTRRYATVADLARDIRHYLNREPIEARPPTAWTRTVRWAMRHPFAVTATVCAAFVLSVFGATLASVYFMNMQPHQIDVESDHRAARLVTRLERTLHQWPESPQAGVESVTRAILLRRPGASMDAGLAVIGFYPSPLHSYGGQLCAFEIDRNRANPVWRHQLTEGDLPPELRKRKLPANSCVPQVVSTADMFDDLAGQEIIVSHALGSYSQRAIRVYDLAGNVQYQVWKNGGIGSFRWLSEPRLLLCSGADKHSEEIVGGSASELGLASPIVFALRLDEREQLTRFVGKPPDDPSGMCAWYRYLHPLTTGLWEATADFTHLDTGYDGRKCAQLAISFKEKPDAGIGLVLDERGNEIGRIVSDGYTRLFKNGEFPDPSVFQLRDDPPTDIYLPPAVPPPATTQPATPRSPGPSAAACPSPAGSKTHLSSASPRALQRLSSGSDFVHDMFK